MGAVAFSKNGNLIASKGNDAVRLWNPESGKCAAALFATTTRDLAAGLAFHPTRPILATVGSDPGTSAEEWGRIINIWELDVRLLDSQSSASPINYTSAKIVMVGESNVGKSYLAHRIATGRRPRKGAIKSTHGMRFWPMEPGQLSPTAKPPSGQRRDVVALGYGRAR